MISKKLLIILLIILVLIVATIIAGVVLISSKKTEKQSQKVGPKIPLSDLTKEELLNLLEEKEAEEAKEKPLELKDFSIFFLTYPRQIKAGLNASFSWKIEAPKGKENTLVKEAYLCLVKNLPKKPESKEVCRFLSKTFSGRVSKVFSAKFKINSPGRYYAWAFAKIYMKDYSAGPISIYVVK
ncbi:hypothetical protein J7K44_02815 [bacterium]|nr:hypothetical protein [bacterium]